MFMPTSLMMISSFSDWMLLARSDHLVSESFPPTGRSYSSHLWVCHVTLHQTPLWCGARGAGQSHQQLNWGFPKTQRPPLSIRGSKPALGPHSSVSVASTLPSSIRVLLQSSLSWPLVVSTASIDHAVPSDTGWWLSKHNLLIWWRWAHSYRKHRLDIVPVVTRVSEGSGADIKIFMEFWNLVSGRSSHVLPWLGLEKERVQI